MSKMKSSVASSNTNGNEFGTGKTKRSLTGKVLKPNGKDVGEVYKEQVKKWSEDVEKTKYGKSLKKTCDAISLNLEKHHKSAEFKVNENQCTNCLDYFSDSNNLESHAAVCISSESQQMNGDKNARCKKWEKQIKIKGEASCGKRKCKFVGAKLSELENHYKTCGVGGLGVFSCIHCSKKFNKKEEHLEHEKSCISLEKSNDECGEKEKMLHFKEIQKMKDRDSNEDHIIQPGPDLPRGAYTRRRPYSVQHKNSWEIALQKCKYVKCMFQNCYFLAMSLEDMISHFGYCNGDGSFAKFVCPHCKGRVTNEAVLAKHVERSHAGEMEDSVGDNTKAKTENEVSTAEDAKMKRKGFEDGESLEYEDVELVRRPSSLKEQSKSPRTYSKRRKINPEKDKPVEEEKVEEKKAESPLPQPKKRGRKPKDKEEVIFNGKDSEKPKDEVECGKCGDFRGIRKSFQDHNIRKHVGLGWVKGETAVDLNNEKEVIKLVKMAFKVTKKGTCEICKDVKKSFLGFATHIRSCGKSEEEKDALKVQCPHCSGKYLKYSLPVHIKLSHSGGAEEEEDVGDGEMRKEEPATSGKRRSALKAASKFQEVLKENEDTEVLESNYFVYEKDSGKLPKTCSRLNNLWYKLKREKKKIPCEHKNCDTLSDDVKEARHHHFTCSQLPDKVFMCETCGLYFTEETFACSHVTQHRRILKRRASAEKFKSENEEEDEFGEEEGEEEEEEDEEAEDEEGEDEEDNDGEPSKKRKRKQDGGRSKKRNPNSAKLDLDLENLAKLKFCRREGLENVRGLNFYSCGLGMTLEEEKPEASKPWPQLHTQLKDWDQVSLETAERVLPEITESISVRFKDNEKWRRFKQLEGDLIDEVPVMFTGGSVRSMSWCKVSHKRMIERSVRQYLAVATTRGFEKLTNIHEPPSDSLKATCLQIWDCGVLENSPAKESPKFALGIISDGGEVRELSWLPEVKSAEGEADRLPRVGILATASEDGAVRIWSVPDPSQFEHNLGLPVYRVEPVVKLITDEDLVDGCLRLSVGREGTIAAGYTNGAMAVWNLSNISSPFCKRQGKCWVLKPNLTIQAHRTAITALTFRPGSSRFVSTAALDRTIKVWDLDSPAVPMEQFTKELCLDNIWARNWPLVIYNYDDTVANLYKGVVRFARDFVPERRQSCLILENTCLSLTFSDWLNALCGSSNAGEVKFTLLKNFIGDQKIKVKTQTTICSLQLEKLNEDGSEGKEDLGKQNHEAEEGKWEVSIATSYQEVSSRFGLAITDNETKNKLKLKKTQVHPEEFPIKAVNKVCFNPNLKSFTHIAVGYNCGLIRIQCLKELQSNRTLRNFLQKAAGQPC